MKEEPQNLEPDVIRLPCAQLLEGDAARDALTCARKGAVDDALVALDRALEQAREGADLVRVGAVLGCMGMLLERAGRNAEGRARLQAAISLFRAQKARTAEAAFMGVLAELRAGAGELEVARSALQMGEAVLREAWTELGSLLVRRAVVETLAGDPVLALAALEDASAVCASDEVYSEIDQAVASLHVSQELAAVA